MYCRVSYSTLGLESDAKVQTLAICLLISAVGCFDPFSFAWPPMKQGESLDFIGIGQAVVRMSGHREGRHLDERNILLMQTNANILGPSLCVGVPGMTIDRIGPVFDRAVGREIGCGFDDNEGVRWQEAPFTGVAMNSFTGGAGHLHVGFSACEALG